MKFLHTADLHIGKSIYEFNLIEDQKHILKEILDIARKEQVDGIILAGDIYDRSVPSTEAVQVLEGFLLSALEIAPVFMIAGNHDGAERLGFGASLFEKSGLYIAGGAKTGEIILTKDGHRAALHLLPFVKPAVVGASDSSEAVARQLEHFKADWDKADSHILVSHFFVCAGEKEPELSDSESPGYVGGLEQVDVSLFAAYDYVALGHIHKPQSMKRGQTYYAGSPLCYSFSECKATDHQATKGVFLVEIGKDKEPEIIGKPLHPLHNMRAVRGSLAELLRLGRDNPEMQEDYIQAVLTDKEELIDPIGSLRSVFPNTMQIVLEKRLQEGGTPVLKGAGCKEKSMAELFGSFYEALTGEPMEKERARVVREIAEEIEGKSL